MHHNTDRERPQSAARLDRRGLLGASAAGTVALLASASRAGAAPADVLTPRADPSDTPYQSVRRYGARGDGTSDDTASIQAAIDGVAAAGGGTVFFPAGTYIVSPSLNTTYITLKSNVNLLGEGDASIIKVKDDAGDYWTIFGGFHTTDPLVANVRISNLRIDQNPSGNTTCNVDQTRTDTTYVRQFTIALFNYHNVVVDNVTFDPTCGVNTITMNNPKCEGAEIRDCSFNFVLAKSDTEYDNSAIYLNGKNHIVIGSRFTAELSQLARGAIETHSGQSVVANNVSDGYQTGVNVQASNTSGVHADITISGNTISNAGNGVMLWTQDANNLSNITVENNTISLANIEWDRYMSAGVGSTNSARYTGAFENVTIRGNTIMFEEELAARASLQETYTYGIGIVKEGATISGLSISGNIIKNCPLAAVRVGYPGDGSAIDNVKVTDNIIVNPGHYPTDAVEHKAAVLLQGGVSDSVVSDNLITDTYDEPRAVYSVRIADEDGVYNGVVVRDNAVRARQGGLWLDLGPGVSDSDASPAAVVPVTSAPPSDGDVEAGQLALVTGTSVSSGMTPMGYKALTSGSFGALTGVTGEISQGSRVLTVNDGASLRVGQFVRVGASDTVYRIVQLSGTTVRVDPPAAADSPAGTSVALANPEVLPLAAIGPTAAIPDTDGASLADLEHQVNLVKQALRDHGVVSS